MRVSNVLILSCCLLFVGFLAGCDDDVSSSVSCSADKDCVTKAGDLFVGDAAVDTLPVCCNSVCLLPAAGGLPNGCGTGYRFMTSAPSYGDCVSAPMCSAPADMSMMPANDGG